MLQLESLHRKPFLFWQATQNRQQHLAEVGKKLNIQIPSDWGKITNQKFIEKGGGSLLFYFGNSLFKLLTSLHPGKQLQK